MGASAHSDSAILEFYHSRETEGWNRYLQLYGPEVWGAKCAEHQLENLTQVYTTLKYSRQDFERWSCGLLQSLEKQGFFPKLAITAAGAIEAPTLHPCSCCGKLSHCIDPARLAKLSPFACCVLMQ